MHSGQNHLLYCDIINFERTYRYLALNFTEEVEERSKVSELHTEQNVDYFETLCFETHYRRLSG